MFLFYYSVYAITLQHWYACFVLLFCVCYHTTPLGTHVFVLLFCVCYHTTTLVRMFLFYYSVYAITLQHWYACFVLLFCVCYHTTTLVRMFCFTILCMLSHYNTGTHVFVLLFCVCYHTTTLGTHVFVLLFCVCYHTTTLVLMFLFYYSVYAITLQHWYACFCFTILCMLSHENIREHSSIM